VGPDEFLVKLRMTGKKGLGIEVDWANGMSLRIKSVKSDGAVPDWNKDHPPNQTVQAEDHVISVNGKSGDPKVMLTECRNKKKLKLLVWAHCVRPAESSPACSSNKARDRRNVQQKLAEAEAQLEESRAKVFKKSSSNTTDFVVSLDMRRHTLLGLDVDWTNGRTLFIKSIHPGAIEEWNRLCHPSMAVQAGATVVAVNGFSGDAQGMAGLCQELCKSQSQLQLRVRGPPPPPPAPHFKELTD